MANKFVFKVDGSNFVITDDVDDRIENLRFIRDQILFDKSATDEYFFKKKSDGTTVGFPTAYPFADIIDFRTGLAFVDADDLNTFLSESIGFFFNPDPVTVVANSPGLLTADFLIEVAKGNVIGHSIFKKFGENPDIDAGDGFADVWAGKTVASGTQKMVAPTQGRIHDIKSSDGFDLGTLIDNGTATGGTLTTLIDTGATFITTGVAVGDLILNDNKILAGTIINVTSETVLTVGRFSNINTGAGDTFDVGNSYRIVRATSTGASVVHLLALDATFSTIEELIILNGTNDVPTVAALSRINRMRALGAGTNNKLNGNVTATAQTDGTITANIIDGDNQTMQAIYTVPIDQTGYLLSWDGSLSKKTAGVGNMRLRAGMINDLMYVLDSKAISSNGSSFFDVALGNQPLPGGVDVLVECDVDTNNMGVSSGFLILLVDN